MYWRYFMWNFAGRQNDIQSHGSVVHGNWISGINFIDEARLGNQKNLPESLAGNKGRNTYYLLPLILGLAGLIFHFNKGDEGKKGVWVVFLLFFMTGLAIVFYLNQYPHQPRERDYAYAASFYAFAIWIGLGVLALAEGLKKFLPETVASGIAGVLTLVLVPGIMAAENWDDHDRSGRYTARDFGANYLITCAPNGIIFTNGDNDTFPLWYNQEVEGTRTDVRVCNLSYLQTDWYINQMRRQSYTSAPMPISMAPEKYLQGTRDIVYLMDNQRINRLTIGTKEAINFVADDNPATKLQQYEYAPYIPKKILSFKIDKEAVIKHKVVRPQDYDKIVDTMYIDLSDRSYITKDEMIILDMLATNNWERPIYWAMTVGRDKYLNLQDYFQLEGFAYRLVPIKGQSQPDRLMFGSVASDIMYENLMNKFKWGGINNPNIYIDENNARMMTNVSNSFSRLAATLIAEGKNDMAIAAIDRCFELMPQNVMSPGYFNIELATNYFKAGASAKGLKAMTEAFNSFNEDLSFYFSLDNRFMRSKSVDEEIQRTLFFVQLIERTARENNQPELAKKASDALQSGLSKFGVK